MLILRGQFPVQCLLLSYSKDKKHEVCRIGIGYKDEGAVKEEIVSCQICHKAVAALGGNTSNLISHLQAHYLLKVLKA